MKRVVGPQVADNQGFYHRAQKRKFVQWRWGLYHLYLVGGTLCYLSALFLITGLALWVGTLSTVLFLVVLVLYARTVTRSPIPKHSNWEFDTKIWLCKGDPLADAVIDLNLLKSNTIKYQNVVALLKETAEEAGNSRNVEGHQISNQHAVYQVCEQFVKQLETVPGWVDWNKIDLGIQVYKNNIILVSAGLAVALVESYAFPSDAQVLFISGGLTTSQMLSVRRLMETGYWVFGIMRGGLRVGEKGHDAVANVRLMHAWARRLCRESVEWRKKENATETPISQATMLATLFLFCHVTLEIAQLRGARLSKVEKDAYWHVWRYVGYLLGVEESIMPHCYEDGLFARASDTYVTRQKPDDASRLLTTTTVEALCKMPNIPFWKGIFEVSAWKFLGDKLSRELGVERPTFIAVFLWWLVKVMYVLVDLLGAVFPLLRWFHNWCFFNYLGCAYEDFFGKYSKTKGRCPFFSA